MTNSFTRTVKSALGLAVLCAAGWSLLSASPAYAAVPFNLNMTTYTPTPQTSYAETGNNDHDVTKHLMLLSATQAFHGDVPQIDTGLYYLPSEVNQSQHVTIGNEGEGDGGLCQIIDSPAFDWSGDYVIVTFTNETSGASQAYTIEGRDVCNNRSDVNYPSDTRPVFYSPYYLPARLFTAGSTDPDTGRFKIRARVSFNPARMSNIRLPHRDQVFNFKLAADTPGTLVGNIDTNSTTESSPNISFNGKFENAGGTNGQTGITQYVTFGLQCRNLNPVESNQPVRLYDADNYEGRQITTPLVFYIAKVNSATSVTPLTVGEYMSKTGGTATSLGNIYVGDSPGLGVRPSVATMQGGVVVFRPGDFNGRGGTTIVKIAKMFRGQRYVMVVKHLDTNGRAGPNNFLYYGLPGDAIYGAPNFSCPPQPTPGVSPAIRFNATSVEAGTTASATASINNTSGFDGKVSNTQVKFWYDTANNRNYSGAAGQSIISSSAWGVSDVPPGGVSQPYSVATSSTTAAKYICGNIQTTPVAPTVLKAGANPNPFDCIPIVFKPYFKVNGGDIEAGIGPGKATDDCTNPNAQIASWNTDSGSYAGAGSEFGAQASAIITGFVSAQRGVGIGPGATLSFANMANTSGGQYGGGFGATGSCFDGAADIKTAAIPASSYVQPGPITNGQHPVDYVTGNVYINSSGITYQNTTWAQLSDIPSYRLVVLGNIYIDQNVSRLDGTYIAQPNGTPNSGNIYTCASSVTKKELSSNNDQASYRQDCSTSLTVNGSLVAKKVFLLRTYGSLAGGSGPAEQFNYVPDIWLAQDSVQVGNPQAITSLSPSL